MSIQSHKTLLPLHGKLAFNIETTYYNRRPIPPFLLSAGILSNHFEHAQNK